MAPRRWPLSGPPPPARPRDGGGHTPPAVGRWRRPDATAPSTVSRSPVRPGVPGPAPVTGWPGTGSGPCGAGPRGPWPVPCPPRPPPGLPGPAGAAELLAPLVRSLLQDDGTVRRPVSVPHGRVRGVPRADRAAMDTVRHRVSRVPHPLCPCRRGVCDPARCGDALPARRARGGLPRVRSASAPRTRPIAGLSTLPARAPVNASRTPLPRPAHDAGPAWLAQPSLSETCTPAHWAGLSRHTRTPAVSRARKPERGKWVGSGSVTLRHVSPIPP